MLVCRINRAVDNPQWELFDSMRAKCFHRLDVGIAVKLGTKIIDGWEGTWSGMKSNPRLRTSS